MAPDVSAEQTAAIGAALAGAPVESLVRAGGGRNSRVHKLVAGGIPYALKQYPSRAGDPHDRQSTEAAALQWMAQQGFSMVPRLVALDREANHSLLSWVEGALVREVGDSDVDQAIGFLRLIHAADTAGSPFPANLLAAEACLSGAEIERQLRARHAALTALPGETSLREFLVGAFSPAFERLLADARAGAPSFEVELPQEGRIHAPADFGFHNALRDQEGRLTFIDFEYFGWDDPVKLTADVLLHPGTPVSRRLRQRFRDAALELYGNDPGFAVRLAAYYPLFGLRWVLILLNEFHPDRWRRRVLAGATGDWEATKAHQLEAARELLDRVTTEGPP